MRRIRAATQRLLEDERAVFRDLVWIGARRRGTSALAERGWWSDMFTTDLDVVDVDDTVQRRTYVGNGDLLSVDNVPLTLGVTAQSMRIELAAMSAVVEEIVREWDARRAPVQVHRVILDPDSHLQTEPAVRRFIGFVDDMEITTPEAGGDGVVRLVCASLSQELQRSNSAKRSDADQRRRDPSDSFFRHAATIHRRKVKWGDQDRK